MEHIHVYTSWSAFEMSPSLNRIHE